ncbi:MULTISPECIES: DUF2975 domain-containing protein [Bradyrhizobium]|jgi:hypothetical protein|uniref:DUF2975 domain-containing protein n=2 Tax=Pseudomonadota TaxID=1224 RepID=UPI000465E3FA|nr:MULTISPECIES: DUF2975 domain-containing protein [Bradyrhizobium]AUC93145.1 DUF2975 domain-containing protein [Bradyrhizobium sp. SK17]KIU51027.1 hypothetical protein QU41_06290 [Bradyrhizobium elkanii]OCX28142.1 hypothetical protein QU42_23950 [Bradyrhizobium sp. UASWS1016]
MSVSLSSEFSPSVRPARLARIRSVSRVLAYACTAISFVLAVGLLAYWLASPDEAILRDAGLNGVAFHPIGWLVRVMSLMVSAMPLACLIWGLSRVRRCFSAFAAGRFFTADNVAGLRDLAIAMLASTLLKPLIGALLSILLSWQTYAQGKSVVIAFGSDTLLALLFAGLVAVTAWVMAEANAIADEHAQFV